MKDSIIGNTGVWGELPREQHYSRQENMQKIVQRFVSKLNQGKEENRSLHRRTQTREPQQAQGLQAVAPTNQD